MAHERIDDFMRLAKDYAKAEKELGVRRWVFISIERIDQVGNAYKLYSYDLPREVYERRRWVVEWRRARLVCQYPRDGVKCYFCFYDKRLWRDSRLNEDLRKLIAAKAQVTKVRRKIAEYVEYNMANNMFFDEGTDAELRKAREKLARNIASVHAAEERMKNYIKTINDEKN